MSNACTGWWTGETPRATIRFAMANTSPDDLGPLPKSDPAHVLSRRSRDRFRSVVQGNLFIVREEGDPDYGKDLSVEVIVGRSVTNFRFQVQLKSLETSDPNADGSISYAIDVANVCYLLNCPKSMYVLYTADDEVLRYQWVDELLRKLESENPSWKLQQTVTVRFDQVLDAAALNEIHAEARRCGTLARDVTHCLGRVGMVGPVSIRVDVAGLQVQDLTQVAAFIELHGMDLVAGGHARTLVDRTEGIPPELLRAPKAALAIAWAELLCGRPLAARSRLQPLDAASLGDEAKDFRDLLLVQAGAMVGMIKREDLQVRLDDIASRSTALAAQVRLAAARRRYLASRQEPDAAQAVLTAANAIKDVDGLAQEVYLQAKLSVLEVQGHEILSDVVATVHGARMRKRLGIMRGSRHTGVAAVETVKRFASWSHAMNVVLVEGAKLPHPLLTADALYVRACLMFNLVLYLTIAPKDEGDPRFGPADVGKLDDIRAAMSAAAEAFALIGFVENELKARMGEADILLLLGRHAEARQVADGVRIAALTGDLVELVEQAEAFMAGRSPVHRMIATGGEHDLASDDDAWLIGVDDAMLGRMAESWIHAFDLDASRKVNVVRELIGLRALAGARNAWCRQLELHVDRSHLASPITAYARPPSWRCHCKARDATSLIDATDPAAVISAFEATACATCTIRSTRDRES